MSTSSTKEAPARPATGVVPKGKPAGGAELAEGRSAAARRSAAAILEVLAGTRTPGQAAAALGLSLPGYYQLEGRALRGLLAGCEPRPRGRGRNPDGALASLQREHERLRRELARQQGLVRLAQRAVGLAPPPAPAGKAAGKRRRRPTTRALTVAARLQPRGGEAGEGTAGVPAAAAGT